MSVVRDLVRIVATGAWVAAATAAAMATLLPDAAAQGATASSPISRSGHVAYPGCPSGAVTVTLTVARRSFSPIQPVLYRTRLHNGSRHACGASRVSNSSPLSPALMPALTSSCGALPLSIRSASGEQVYPPPEAIACPALVAPRLRARATVTASGSWDQFQGGGRPARRIGLVPRGNYRLVVGGVSVPFVLAGPVPS